MSQFLILVFVSLVLLGWLCELVWDDANLATLKTLPWSYQHKS